MTMKSFQGEGLDTWVAGLKKSFDKVNVTKPKASRSESEKCLLSLLASVIRSWLGNRTLAGLDIPS